MITDGKPITKFGKAFMQLGIGRIGEFQFPVLFALTLILLSSPLMFHVNGEITYRPWAAVRRR